MLRVYEKKLKLQPSLQCTETELHFGVDFALTKKLPTLIEKRDRKTVLITDENVERLYRDKMKELDCKILVIPPGESSKSRAIKEKIEDDLLSQHFGRDSLMISLGGGVVSDLAGFVASTYCRGIPLVHVPTTLLGMVDASIGGKTSVNTPHGKNLIGTFYLPQEVVIDVAFLQSLPEKQWKNGIVEIIKYGLIASPSLFSSMCDHIEKWHMQDLPYILERVIESCAIKAKVVEQDFHENGGLRRILNLGHTIAHALETLHLYQIEHGEAVAIGLLVSCFISRKMGFLSKEHFKKIHRVLIEYELPLELPQNLKIEQILATLALDKKTIGGTPRFVLLKEIGSVVPFEGDYCTPVPLPLLEEALNWMGAQLCGVYG